MYYLYVETSHQEIKRNAVGRGLVTPSKSSSIISSALYKQQTNTTGFLHSIHTLYPSTATQQCRFLLAYCQQSCCFSELLDPAQELAMPSDMSIKWSLQERDYVRLRRGQFPQVGDIHLLIPTHGTVHRPDHHHLGPYIKMDLNRLSSIFLEGFL